MVINVAWISKTVASLACPETQRDINNLEDKRMELEMRQCENNDDDRRSFD
jgi:hypothetical protein